MAMLLCLCLILRLIAEYITCLAPLRQLSQYFLVTLPYLQMLHQGGFPIFPIRMLSRPSTNSLPGRPGIPAYRIAIQMFPPNARSLLNETNMLATLLHIYTAHRAHCLMLRCSCHEDMLAPSDEDQIFAYTKTPQTKLSRTVCHTVYNAFCLLGQACSGGSAIQLCDGQAALEPARTPPSTCYTYSHAAYERRDVSLLVCIPRGMQGSHKGFPLS